MTVGRYVAQSMQTSTRELPAGWSRRALGDVLDVVNGRAYKQEELLSSGVPVLRIQNLNGGDRWYYSNLRLEPSKYCEAGDLLYAWSATFGPYRYSGPRAIFHYHIWRVVPGPEIDQDFAFWLLKEITGEVKAAAHGVAMPHMTKAGVEAWPIVLPPLGEQKRIVAKLDTLKARSSRVRETLDAVPPLLEKLRQSILAAAFRGDLTKGWREKHPDVEPATELLKRIRLERRKKWEEAQLAKMKAKGRVATDDKWKAKYDEPEPVDALGLPTLPNGWCWASIGDLAHVGTGATPKRSEDKYYLGGTVAWVTSGALNDEAVREPTELVTERAVAETNLTVYPPGTILLAMYGEGKTRGMVAELCIDAATNQAIAAICLEGSAADTKSLVRLALAQNYVKIRSVSMGGVQPNLNLEKVRALAVPLCPVAETRILARVVGAALDRVSALVDISHQQVASLDALNRSLLTRAFRGELVRQELANRRTATDSRRAGRTERGT